MSRSHALPSALAALVVVLAGCGTAAREPAEATLLEPTREPTIASASAPPSSEVASRLDAQSRAALARAPFPVLLFPSRWTSQVMSAEGEPWVAVAAHDDGLHVSLHGSSLAHPDLRDEEVMNLPSPTTLVRGSPAWITLNEQIRGASWHEGEVAWALEVECDRPFDDTRCTEDDFVRALAETLVLVAPQAGGAR